MTDTHESPEPWADVSLPAAFDAREIYEYATAVGAERRGQRRRRQLVVTICGCLVVALTAAGIAVSGDDGGGASIQLATQQTIPHEPTRSAATVPDSTPHRRAPAQHKAAAPATPPITSQCRAFALLTSSVSAQLTAFHAADPPAADTTTTTTTEPDPPTTTTTTAPPPTTTTTRPPTTTPTTRRRTTPTTHIVLSPRTAFTPPPVAPGNSPIPPPSFAPPRRTRC